MKPPWYCRILRCCVVKDGDEPPLTLIPIIAWKEICHGDHGGQLDNYTLQNTAAVHFAFDSYELTPDSRAALDQLAMQIKDRNNFILEIQGFADWIGKDTYNNQLTQRRADAVRRYLAEQHDIPLFRMHILGFGEMRPVADNRTREGRAENRRVEIRLLARNVGGAASVQTKTTELR